MEIKMLEAMRNIDITKVDKGTLVDLNSVHIDAAAPLAERFSQFLAQIKNPYSYRVDEVAVKVEFTQNGRPLYTILSSHLATLKEHT